MPAKPWAVKGTPETRKNLVTSIFLETDDLEAHQRKLEAKYHAGGEEGVPLRDCITADDADFLLVGYGIVSRVLRSIVENMRAQGLRAGLFRPISLWPFPRRPWRRRRARAESVLVVELSNGQMVEDVRLAVNGAPVEFYSRVGGNVPSAKRFENELMQRIAQLA